MDTYDTVILQDSPHVYYPLDDTGLAQHHFRPADDEEFRPTSSDEIFRPYGFRDVALHADGVTVDLSGNARHGSYNGAGFTYEQTGPAFNDGVGLAVESDGTAGTYVQSPELSHLLSNDITLEAWVNLDNPALSTGNLLAIHNPTQAMIISVDVITKRFKFDILDAFILDTFYGATYSTNRWMHIAVVNDSNDLVSMYQDGALVLQRTSNAGQFSGPPNTTTFRVGHLTATLEGLFAKAAYYRTALSESQIARHYAAGVGSIATLSGTTYRAV